MRRWAVCALLCSCAAGAGRGWVDKATPEEAKTIVSLTDQKPMELVMSDEFEVDGRSFADGEDDRWTALEKNDYTNDALHFYSDRRAHTSDGKLVVETKPERTFIKGFDDIKRKEVLVVKNFTSAMLQSWNKFCFTGGVVEARIKLPGRAFVGGLWPAFWLLGNLARHTYVGTSNWIWPWSKSDCNEKLIHSQEINGCLSTDHYQMQRHQGRGAPEIDILEGQPGPTPVGVGDYLKSLVGQPFISTSLQVAPGRSAQRPGPGNWPGPGEWYQGIAHGPNSSININFYGNYNFFGKEFAAPEYSYWSDAISWNTQLNESHFEQFHNYRLEWGPPDVDDPKQGGFLAWYIDNQMVLHMNSTNLNSGDTGAEIPSEPSYILFNVAVSKNWGFPKIPEGEPCPRECFDCDAAAKWECKCGLPAGFCAQLTTEMLVDHVRVWQNPDDERQKVGCSTPERPTKAYIKGHTEVYKLANQKAPLQPTSRGGGSCMPRAGGDEVCGIDDARGECVALWYDGLFGVQAGRCVCADGWSGSMCRNSAASDPIEWDPDVTAGDLGFQSPIMANFVVYVVTVGLVFVGGLLRYFEDRGGKRRRQ